VHVLRAGQRRGVRGGLLDGIAGGIEADLGELLEVGEGKLGEVGELVDRGFVGDAELLDFEHVWLLRL